MARPPKVQPGQPLTKAQQADADLKENFQEFASKNFPSFCKAYDKLAEDSPRDACKVYTDILKYITAPVQASPLDTTPVDADKEEMDKYKSHIRAMRDKM